MPHLLFQPLRSPSAKNMFALEASIDTFHAFTKTVEALALQESVIGNVVSTCFMCIVKNVKLVNAWLKF